MVKAKRLFKTLAHQTTDTKITDQFYAESEATQTYIH